MSDMHLNKLTLDLLLESLSAQDRDTIILWFIEGYTLKEIATIISGRYLPRGSTPIGPRTIGIRIHKILEKLRQNAGVKGDLDIVSPRKAKKRLGMETHELG